MRSPRSSGADLSRNLLKKPRRRRGFLLRRNAANLPAKMPGNDFIPRVLHLSRRMTNAEYSASARLPAQSKGDNMDEMLLKYRPTALSLFRFITGLLLFQ